MRELAQEELTRLAGQREAALADLKVLLIPKDPNDAKNVILEIRAGTGGDEAALFAADLFRMYTRYAERNGWKVETMSLSESGVGGIKEVIATIAGRNVYSRLKYESGVHRVQRIPVTESGGRIHTSTVSVNVLPEAEEFDIEIRPDDIRVDVYRSSGHGGQGVNTTDSAVRITHLPTGIVVSCQNERSQIQNRAKAMQILAARLAERQREERRAELEKLSGEKSQVAFGSQIRSYTLAPYQLVKDERTRYETGNVQAVLDGDLDPFVEAYLQWRRQHAGSA
jgi:peptide chain release factor 1